MSPLQKITEAQMDANGVCAAPNVLNDTVPKNKAMFDKMVRSVVAPVVNAAVDAVNSVEMQEATIAAAENNRMAAERGRETAEGKRDTAEKSRIMQEEGRRTEENLRTGNEQRRGIAEESRDTAEKTRIKNEQNRHAAEENRVTAESARAYCQPYYPTAMYAPGNKVTYNGSSYQCTAPCTGVLPTNTANWICIAAGGSVRTGEDVILKGYALGPTGDVIPEDNVNAALAKLSASLSNKVEKFDFAPVRDRVLSRSSIYKEYAMDVSQAQAFLDALPRMMSEVIVLKLTGTLKTRLILSGFYGDGRIILSAASGSFTLEQGALLNEISLAVGFINAVFPPSAAVDGIALDCHCSKFVFLEKCYFAGNGQNVALNVTNATNLSATDCTISGYKTAAIAITDSIITVAGDKAADFHDNTTGAYVWHGGIILLSGSVPDLLGGTVNCHQGGIIVNAAGAVI